MNRPQPHQQQESRERDQLPQLAVAPNFNWTLYQNHMSSPPQPLFKVKFRTSPFSKYKECAIKSLPPQTNISRQPSPASTNVQPGKSLGQQKHAEDTDYNGAVPSGPVQNLSEQSHQPPSSYGHRTAESETEQGQASLNHSPSHVHPETDWTVTKQSRAEVGMSVPGGVHNGRGVPSSKGKGGGGSNPEAARRQSSRRRDKRRNSSRGSSRRNSSFRRRRGSSFSNIKLDGEGKASEGEEMGTALTMLAQKKRSL